VEIPDGTEKDQTCRESEFDFHVPHRRVGDFFCDNRSGSGPESRPGAVKNLFCTRRAL
jgi:hypothetical protein